MPADPPDWSELTAGRGPCLARPHALAARTGAASPRSALDFPGGAARQHLGSPPRKPTTGLGLSSDREGRHGSNRCAGTGHAFGSASRTKQRPCRPRLELTLAVAVGHSPLAPLGGAVLHRPAIKQQLQGAGAVCGGPEPCRTPAHTSSNGLDGSDSTAVLAGRLRPAAAGPMPPRSGKTRQR